MKIDNNIIYADPGMVLRRISDSLVVGKEYALGYAYYKMGKKLATPELELASDFEEIDEDYQYPILVESLIRVKYSVSDELAIQRQRDTKPEAFNEYFEYCESCKRKAREELSKS